jgi:hypothetical protein
MHCQFLTESSIFVTSSTYTTACCNGFRFIKVYKNLNFLFPAVCCKSIVVASANKDFLQYSYDNVGGTYNIIDGKIVNDR